MAASSIGAFTPPKAAVAAPVTAAPPKKKHMTPAQRRRLGVILGASFAGLVLAASIVVVVVIILKNHNTIHNFVVPANTTAPPDRGPPVACPVNSSNFCTLLGRAENIGGCHFNSAWTNAQCELSCPTVLDFWLGVTYPKNAQLGLFRRPDPKIDNSSAAADDVDHNAACALASAFYGLAENPTPNAGSAAEPGYRNFYSSIAACVRTSYYCG